MKAPHIDITRMKNVNRKMTELLVSMTLIEEVAIGWLMVKGDGTFEIAEKLLKIILYWRLICI